MTSEDTTISELHVDEMVEREMRERELVRTQEKLSETIFIDRVFYRIDDNKLVSRARYLMEKSLNRELKQNEIIHHINENPMDDRIENLQVMSRSEHGKLHGNGKKKTWNNGPKNLPLGGCIIQKMVGKWGPYLYHVKRVGKKQIWTYLGKSSELVRERVGNSAEGE